VMGAGVQGLGEAPWLDLDAPAATDGRWARPFNGGSRGLVYPSVRDPGGTCIVAFQPNAVQDVTPGANWKISWNGSPVWAATAV